MKLKRLLASILAMCMVLSTMSFNVFAEEAALVAAEATAVSDDNLYVSTDYNSETEGYGVTKFNSYNAAYSYAIANNTSATIVIEKNNGISGFCFDNNHKNYSKLAVVIKDGATMGVSLSKWDMTYPVTVEAGGTLTCARPKSASVSNIHIKNKLIIGTEGSDKQAYCYFLSDEYQDCDISIRYNGSVTLYNAVMTVQDLDAQGSFTATDSDITIDGAFASATFLATTLTDSSMQINGNQINGGLSDFSGGTVNQLGKVTLNGDSSIVFDEGSTVNVAANVTVNGNSSITADTLTVAKNKKINVNGTSSVIAQTLTNNGTIAAVSGATVTAETVSEGSTGAVTIDGKEAAFDESGSLVLPPEAVATVNGVKYTDIQEAIVAAAPSGTVTLLKDVTVEKWIMISESLTIGDGTVITLDMDGLTIDGDGHTLTVNDIESAGNGNHLFYDGDYNVCDLTINMATNVNGLGITSGSIENVTFIGGLETSVGAAIHVSDGKITGVHAGDVAIKGCTFKNNGAAIYFETAQNGLVVEDNTFEVPAGANVILLRGTEQFKNNTVVSGRTVNVVSGSPVVKDNNFGDVRLKVYNGATATIENNVINVLTFNDDSEVQSIFGENTLSADAEQALKKAGVIEEGGLAGSGTAEDPYLIKTIDDLEWFRDDVNGGNNYNGKHIKLTADIDLANEEWTPIGYMGKSFLGTFDGGNKTIKNLYINKGLENTSANNGIGFFGRTDDPAVIQNLTIENADVSGSLYVGAIVGMGYTGKKIENCTVKGQIAIDAWWYAGVIGGNGYMSLIDDCHVIGENGSYVKGNDGSYIGGIWGFRGEGNNKITDCTVTNISLTGVDRVGGICGIGHYGNTLSDCEVNKVAIQATDSDATTVGLIVGACQGTASEPTVFGDNTVTETTAKIGETEVKNLYGTNINGSTPVTNYVAKIGSTMYTSIEDALTAAKAGDEIVLLANVEGDITIPAGVIFNGNGFAVSGGIIADGTITFEGITKAMDFYVNYVGTTIHIGKGASLELTGTARLVVGHDCTFNIEGNIANAKTANVADLTPSLIVAAGASFTGTNLTFNVTNAYIKFNNNSTSKNKAANGTFNFNITNSIWEQTGSLVFSAPTEGMDPTFNFNLKDSVLNSTSHLVFAVTKGEIVFDNSNVNSENNKKQLENRSNLTIKNGSVVYAAVATSENAKNPGTLTVDNATYIATGEFSGSDLGTGSLILKNGATANVAKISKDKATVTLGAGCTLTCTTADLAINTDAGYEVQYENGVYTAVKAPVAYIGEQGYETVQAAINAAQNGETVTISAGEYSAINISNKNITIQGTVGDNGELLTTIKGGNPAITGHSFNGTIKDIKIVDAWKVMYAESAGNITVDNVYVTGATYGFHLVAYSTDLTWKIENSYMDLAWANSFGVYKNGYADIIIKGNEFISTNPYYPDYGAIHVNSFLPSVTVEENIFHENARIYIDKSVTDTSKIKISKNYHADGVENAFADDADGVKVKIGSYYTSVDENGNLTNLVITPSGSINGGLVNIENPERTFLTIESYLTYANESVVVKVYDANDTLLVTSSLIDNDRVILGKENWGGLSTMVGINCTDEWWNTVWETGKLNANYVPAKAILIVDGVEMNTAPIQMRAAGTETEVVWAEVPGVPGAPVAKIGDVEYETIEAAFEAATDGDTVTLIRDIELTKTVTVANGQNITLDLNGKTISGVCNASQAHLFMVNNGAKLTIKDSSAEQTGKITYAGENSTGWIVDVEGNLVLESGTLELTGTWNIGYAVDVRPNAWGTAYTEGTAFVMNGGKIVSSDGAVRVASSSADSYSNVSASFTMNGGEIEAAWDGVFVQQSNAAWDVLNVTINNGTIKSDLNPVRFYGPAATSYVNGEDCVDIALNGGTLTYTGTETREWLVDGILRLGGGVTADEFLKDSSVTASADFASANVAEGYVWVESNGVYTLEKEEPVTELFYLDEVSATLESSLALNIYLKSSDLTGEDYYAVVEHTKTDGVVKTTIPYADWTTKEDKKVIHYTGIAAKEMADNIKITVYHADGTQASIAHDTSLRDYALGMLNLYSQYPAYSHWLPVFVDMLNYGAAAQTIFNYNTSDLASKGAENFQHHASSMPTLDDSGCSATENVYEISLTLEEMIKLNVFFGDVTADMKAKYSYTTHSGASIEGEVDFASFKKRTINGKTCYGVPVDIAVADAASLVTVTLYKGDGSIAGSAVYSANAYLKGMIEWVGATDEIYPALATFAASAKQAFAKK